MSTEIGGSPIKKWLHRYNIKRIITPLLQERELTMGNMEAVFFLKHYNGFGLIPIQKNNKTEHTEMALRAINYIAGCVSFNTKHILLPIFLSKKPYKDACL